MKWSIHSSYTNQICPSNVNLDDDEKKIKIFHFRCNFSILSTSYGWSRCVCVCEKFSEWIEINWPFGRLFFSPILLLYTYVIEIMLVVVCCLLSIDDCSIFFDEGDGVWLLVVVLFQMCQSMWSLCMCVIENKIEIEIQFMFLQIFNYSCCCCCCRFHISFVIVVLYYCLIWLSCFFYTTSGLYYQAFFLVIYLLKLDFFFVSGYYIFNDLMQSSNQWIDTERIDVNIYVVCRCDNLTNKY